MGVLLAREDRRFAQFATHNVRDRGLVLEHVLNVGVERAVADLIRKLGRGLALEKFAVMVVVIFQMVPTIEHQHRRNRRARGLLGKEHIQLLDRLGFIKRIPVLGAMPHVISVVAVAGAAKAEADDLAAIATLPAQVSRLARLDPAPDEGSANPEAKQNLGKLTDMAEQIADKTRARWLGSVSPRHLAPEAEVPDNRLAGDDPLVRQHEPWADVELSIARVFFNLRAALGADLKIIIQDDRLAVGRERPAKFAGGQIIERPVHQVDEAAAVVLECLIPFTVPVGAEDIVDGSWSLFVFH